MALPNVEIPRYELTLPSQDEKVQFRPFLVKEEKILLMAMESKDNKEIVSATKQILNACTFNKLNINTLPMFDIEYILLQVRAKSVGEVSKFRVLCPDDKETLVEVELDLSKVNVNVDDDHTNKIVIDKKRNLGLVLNYPSLETSQAGFDMDDKDIDSVFSIIISCVDLIYEGDKIFPAKDSTNEELKDFIESLSQEAFKNIKTFFGTMPQLRHEIEVENPKTKIKSKVVFKGLQDFFQ